MTGKNIAIDARPLYGNKSGVGMYTHNILHNLAELDRHNRYGLYTTGDFNSSLLEKNNITKKRFWFPYSNIWFQTVLPLQLKIDKIDLFHGTNFIVPLVSSVRSIITIHDLTSFLFPEMHKVTNNWVQRLVPRAANRCSKIIAVSKQTKKDIITILGIREEKITVIYEGVEERFRPIADTHILNPVKKRYCLPKRFILFVGTLEPRKNIITVIKAFNQLKKNDFPDLKLVIAGKKGWNFKQIFQEVTLLNLTKEIHFLNYFNSEDLPCLYNLADLFIFPSLYEGFGLPPLESMACGTPAIVSNTSAFPEIVQDAAAMVEPMDVSAICRAAETLLSHKEKREEQIARGLLRAASFSWKKAAQETFNLYNEVLA